MPLPLAARYKCPAGPAPRQCPGQLVSPSGASTFPCPSRPCFHNGPALPVRPAWPAALYPSRPLSSRRAAMSPEGRRDLPGKLWGRSVRNLPAITADHGENRNNYGLSRFRAPARARGARSPVPGFPAFSRPRRYLRRNDLATNFPGSGLLRAGKTDKPRIF